METMTKEQDHQKTLYCTSAITVASTAKPNADCRPIRHEARSVAPRERRIRRRKAGKTAMWSFSTLLDNWYF